MKSSTLKLVQTTEDILREALIGRDEAMRTVREFDAIISSELKVLAKERGVIFLREETIKRELFEQVLANV